ncbi:MAG: anti-sigma factor [Arthrobacter sp.]|nr:anti-sigma factor [Arthrobacter sp.]
MENTNREHRDELLVGLALNALATPDEEAEARRLVAEDPEAAAELRAYLETSAELARLASSQPPTGAKAAVFARIDALAEHTAARSQSEAAATGTAGAVREAEALPDGVLEWRPRRRLAPWLAAAAAVAIAIPAVGIAVSQHQRAVVAESTSSRIITLLSQPDASVTTQALSGSSGTVTVVAGPAGSEIITRGLPGAGEGHTYQLWTIQAGGQPVSVGLVGEGDAVTSAAHQPAGSTVAITVEPTGGSTQPTQDPLAAITLG